MKGAQPQTNAKTESSIYVPDRIAAMLYIAFDAFYIVYRNLKGSKPMPMDSFTAVMYVVTFVGFIGLLFSKRWAIWLLAVINALGLVGIARIMLQHGVFYPSFVTNFLFTVYLLVRLVWDRNIGRGHRPI